MHRRVAIIFPVFTLLSAHTALAQEVTLKLQPPAGTDYRVEAKSEQVLTQTIMGNQQVNNSKAIRYMDLTFGQAADGVVPAEAVITRNAFYMEQGFVQETYDSYDTDSEVSGTTASYAAMVDKPASVTYSATGEPEELANQDFFAQELADTLVALSLAETTEEALAEAAKEDFLHSFQLSDLVLPGSTVNVGDSWSHASEKDRTFLLKSDLTYTLASVEDGLATINMSGQLKVEDSKTKQGSMELVFNLEGTVTGEFTVDLTSGLVLSSTVEDMLEGTAYIMPSTQMPNGLSLPMTIDRTKTVAGEVK